MSDDTVREYRIVVTFRSTRAVAEHVKAMMEIVAKAVYNDERALTDERAR